MIHGNQNQRKNLEEPLEHSHTRINGAAPRPPTMAPPGHPWRTVLAPTGRLPLVVAP